MSLADLFSKPLQRFVSVDSATVGRHAVKSGDAMEQGLAKFEKTFGRDTYAGSPAASQVRDEAYSRDVLDQLPETWSQTAADQAMATFKDHGFAFVKKAEDGSQLLHYGPETYGVPVFSGWTDFSKPRDVAGTITHALAWNWPTAEGQVNQLTDALRKIGKIADQNGVEQAPSRFSAYA